MTSEVTQADRDFVILACRLTGWEGVAQRLERGWKPDRDTNEGKLLDAAVQHRLTAQSGEGRALPWLSKLLRYHETGGHEGDGSDHAMRNARTELDAIVSGEGRSGAGEEALRDALNAFTDAVGKKCREAGLSYELPRAEALKAGMVAALNARQSGEGEREADLRDALSDLWSIVHGCDLRLSVPMETIAKVRAALNARQSGEGEREGSLAIVECSDPNEGWSLSIKFGSGDHARDKMRALSDRLRAGEV